MSVSRQSGDRAFSRRDFHGAIEHYTLALEQRSSGEDLSLETKRAILSQRAQANVRAGAFYDALLDCDRALASEYTTEQSGKQLTGTLHLQRAHVKQILADFAEAYVDFVKFEEVWASLGLRMSAADGQVQHKIARGMSLREDCEEMKRVKLIRAVQARGLLLSPNYRHSFPRDPANDPDDNEEDAGETCFESGSPGNDYLKEPISVLFHFFAPYLDPPSNALGSVKTVLPEDAIIGDNVQGMFTFASLRAVADVRDHAWYDSVIKHESPEQSALVFLTRRGRVLAVPWDTKVCDIWCGARWPRDGPSPFEVLWSPPTWPHEVDGMELLHGCLIPVYVVPKEQLAGFVERLARHHTEMKARRRAKFEDLESAGKDIGRQRRVYGRLVL